MFTAVTVRYRVPVAAVEILAQSNAKFGAKFDLKFGAKLGSDIPRAHIHPARSHFFCYLRTVFCKLCIDRRGHSELVCESHMHLFLNSVRRPLSGGLAAGAMIARVTIAGTVIVGLLSAAPSFALPPQNVPMPRAQKHESRMVIDQLEDKWRDAILKDDASAMQNLLADDYTGITAFGTLQSKEDTVSSLRSGSLHITTLDLSDRKVRFYGSTALVTSAAIVEGATPDGNVSGDFRYSHVFVRDAQGNWKIVNFEASHVRQPHLPHEHEPK